MGQKQRSKIVISHPPVINGGLQFGFKDGGQVFVPGIFRVHWSKHVKLSLIHSTYKAGPNAKIYELRFEYGFYGPDGDQSECRILKAYNKVELQ